MMYVYFLTRSDATAALHLEQEEPMGQLQAASLCCRKQRDSAGPRQAPVSRRMRAQTYNDLTTARPRRAVWLNGCDAL